MAWDEGCAAQDGPDYLLAVDWPVFTVIINFTRWCKTSNITSNNLCTVILEPNCGYKLCGPRVV